MGAPNIGNRTLVDKAIDQIGVSTPLLEFHPLPSRCDTLDNMTQSLGEFQEPKDAATQITSKSEETYDDEIDMDELSSPTPAPKVVGLEEGPNILWNAMNSSHHPFIVTRTQLVVVDETRPFDLKAFNNAYRNLKDLAVSQGSISITAFSVLTIMPLRVSQCADVAHAAYLGPHQKWCNSGPYSNIGHWAMRIKVAKESGNNETEWMYPPYMFTADNAAGPLVWVSSLCSPCSVRVSAMADWVLLHRTSSLYP